MANTVTVDLPKRQHKGGRGRSTGWIKFSSKYSPEAAALLDALRKRDPDYNKAAVIDMALKEWLNNRWDEIEPPGEPDLVFVPVVTRENGKEITYMAYVEYAKELGIEPHALDTQKSIGQ